jgi:hypothetical protein
VFRDLSHYQKKRFISLIKPNPTCTYILWKKVDDQYPERINLKFDQLMYIWRDVALLENQLPYQMLEIICNERGNDLNFLVSNYQGMGSCKRYGMTLIPLKNITQINGRHGWLKLTIHHGIYDCLYSCMAI